MTDCRSYTSIWIGLAVFIMTMGCGYHLAGSGNLPGGVQTICVSIFENKSSEAGIESELTNDIIYEFTRRGRKVMTNPEQSDSVMKGTIKSISVETASYKADKTTLESRVKIVVDVSLKNSNGDELRSLDNVSADQTYVADSSTDTNGPNKRDAIAKVMKRMAENIHNSMTEDF
jgi:outer membrane lipopolysaccharide assembly protein LptE/RlpB